VLHPELHFFAVAHPGLTVPAQWIGYLGAALGTSMSVPQIVRTYRDRSLPGVSVSTWALTALASLAWFLYGIRSGALPQLPGNVLAALGAAFVVLGVPARISRRTRALAMALVAGVLVVLTVELSAIGIEWVAFTIGLVSALPQTISSLRDDEGSDAGVSVQSWLLCAGGHASWLTYGLIMHNVPVTLVTALGLTTALIVAVRTLRHRELAPTVAVAAAL
jgi:uncharacterized protein with PQ loop repeat